MKNETAKTAKKPAQKTAENTAARQLADENTALDRCYRQIGISAVAAAVRYQGVAKNPAYAPAQAKSHDRTGEAA